MIPLRLIDKSSKNEINLSGIQTHSKLIKAGNLFVKWVVLNSENRQKK